MDCGGELSKSAWWFATGYKGLSSERWRGQSEWQRGTFALALSALSEAIVFTLQVVARLCEVDNVVPANLRSVQASNWSTYTLSRTIISAMRCILSEYVRSHWKPPQRQRVDEQTRVSSAEPFKTITHRVFLYKPLCPLNTTVGKRTDCSRTPAGKDSRPRPYRPAKRRQKGPGHLLAGRKAGDEEPRRVCTVGSFQTFSRSRTWIGTRIRSFHPNLNVYRSSSVVGEQRSRIAYLTTSL